MGNVAALLPEDTPHLADAPYPLVNAMEVGLLFLGWQDNLPKDELPPRRIWDDQKKLQAHFKWVEKKREAEADPDKAIADKPIEDPVENDIDLIHYG